MAEREWGAGLSVREKKRDRALVIKDHPCGARVIVYDRRSDDHLGINLSFDQVVAVIRILDQAAAKNKHQAREAANHKGQE